MSSRCRRPAQSRWSPTYPLAPALPAQRTPPHPPHGQSQRCCGAGQSRTPADLLESPRTGGGPLPARVLGCARARGAPPAGMQHLGLPGAPSGGAYQHTRRLPSGWGPRCGQCTERWRGCCRRGWSALCLLPSHCLLHCSHVCRPPAHAPARTHHPSAILSTISPGVSRSGPSPHPWAPLVLVPASRTSPGTGRLSTVPYPWGHAQARQVDQARSPVARTQWRTGPGEPAQLWCVWEFVRWRLCRRGSLRLLDRPACRGIPPLERPRFLAASGSHLLEVSSHACRTVCQPRFA
mmetsp:Transcript_4726/g.11449  ORF Transcript_4726/g.11449 Transcript_4726/m.11449 type:complete len:293 (+) Transcript_4726:328-1206(+)